ncbi:hypothetical protein QJN73_25545, partial [Escherichia coli]
TRTFPGKSNVTGRQRVVAFKVDGIPTRTAPDKSNVIRGIQRGNAINLKGNNTLTASNITLTGESTSGNAINLTDTTGTTTLNA